MSLSPQAFIKSIVQRALPSLNQDSPNNDIALRLDSYGGVYTQPLVRKNTALADEGSYWLQNSTQTGITPPLGVSFSATVAALVIYNNDSLGRSLALDYICLTNTVAVTMTSSVAGAPNFFAIAIDNGNRLSSGGTTLTTPFNANMSKASQYPSVTATFGNLTATAATSAVRYLVGTRVLRPNATTSAATVVGDMFYFNFGGVEATSAANITVANPNIIPQPCPPVVIGPGQSLVLHAWWANTTPAGGASGFLPEVGFWMR